MKKLTLHILFATLVITLASARSEAQCPGGYTQSQVNWDQLDVYYRGGAYNSYITDAQEQTQKFGFGNTIMTMYSSSTALLNSSENGSHTGELAGYTGDDVQFSDPAANGVYVELTFDVPVLNATFALYDIDESAVYTITALDPASAPLVVTITESSATLSVVGGVITATAAAHANNSNNGTAVITVAGSTSNPVKQIRITVTNRGAGTREFYMSDIDACVSTSFSTSWHTGFNNQPFTGNVQNQPDYFIVTPDNNSAYMMDPATGRCWWLFTDATRTYMNSFAYDPNNKILYYITENVSLNSNNKQLKAYNFDTESSSVIINDIETTLGIPPFNAGVESAAAAFYEGYLYLGIEGGESSGTIRESVVWKIDLSNNTACQVHATPAYDGTGIIHDWADILVKDGVLISYNSSRSGSNYTKSSYTHFDMMTGASTRYNNPSPGQKYAGQAGLNWSGQMYMIYDSVWQYSNGVISNKQPISVITVPGSPVPPAWAGNAGDGSDPFRPKSDFGDAPASYDPNSNAPAVHERSEEIRFGATWDREWLKRGVTANNDVDDASSYVPFLASGAASYVVGATVYNNSGSNATLIAWLDINGNGLFDASEAITPITVSSSASNQNFWLYWPNASNSFVNGQTTYLRMRITSGAMTANDATGYFSNGEVEDYRIPVDDYPLSTTRLEFNLSLVNDKDARLEWSFDQDGTVTGFQVERSSDSRNWETITIVGTNGLQGTQHFDYTDLNLPYGVHYYRVRMIGNGKYSEIRSVKRIRLDDVVAIRPNPVKEKVTIHLETSVKAVAYISILTMDGKQLMRTNRKVNAGATDTEIRIDPAIPNGTYILHIRLNNEMVSRKLVVHR